MTDGFAQLIDASNAFFEELAQNNSKAWFEPRKSAYNSGIKKPAELLGVALAGDIERLTGRSYKPKLFRIHRDVRFSNDKTPYNTHLHLMWTDPSQPGAPGWFFGSSPDYLIVGCGLMALDKDALTRFRAGVDRDGTALAAALAEVGETAGARLADYGPAPLKRVPKPYDADHPHANLMKRKSLAVSAPVPPDWRQSGLIDATRQGAEKLLPVYLWLNATLV